MNPNKAESQKKLFEFIIRILLSIALLIGAYWMLSAPTHTLTKTDKKNPDHEIANAWETSPKFWDWVGLFSLAFPVWLWRKELGINTFGFFGGPEVSQGVPKTPEELDPTTPANAKPPSAEEQTKEREVREQVILKQVKNKRAVTVNQVATELNISLPTAKALLFKMVENGILRCDGFPKSTQFTHTLSLENLAIDRVKSDLQKWHEIVSERRFVRIDKFYDVDALFETDAGVYVVEIRSIRQGISFTALENLTSRLIATAQRFKDRPHVFLALLVDDNLIAAEIDKWVNRFSTESGGIPIQLKVYSESDLNHPEGS